MKPDAAPPTPLEPDDPRISEWIDGRLSAAEADLIERAVQASAALAALVADLRAIKEAARLVSAAATPAGGFTDRVMARVAKQATADAESDRAVDVEWETIEAERIAAERAEAAADLVEAAREPRPRWPWMALAGALAAGLLMTVVLNFPDGGGREVALAPKAEADRELTAATEEAERLAAGPLIEETQLTATPSAAAQLAAPAEVAATASRPEPGDDGPGSDGVLADRLARAQPAIARPQLGAAEAAARPLGKSVASPGPTAAVAESLAGLAADRQAAQEAGADRRGGRATDIVVVTVRGRAGTREFEARAAALGLTLDRADEEMPRDEADQAKAEPRARRAGAGPSAVIAISGPADAIETLLTDAKSRSPTAPPGREAEGLRMSGDRLELKGASEARVLVRLIELPEPAFPSSVEPSEAAPAGPEPGAEP